MATIYDVAARAGVSPKTVSRVINGDAPVSPQTREAVEKAIALLGYIPSSAARAMRSQRSGLVGVITGALSEGASETAERGRGLPDMFLVQGIRSRLRASGKMVMMADTDNRSDRLAPLIRSFMEYRVEGILYVAEHYQKVSLAGVPAACPVVLVNCYDGADTPAVVPADEQGQYELVRRIITGGHRRIAYITMRADMDAMRLRIRGYRRALEEAGIAFDAGLLQTGYSDGSYNSTSLLESIDKLLALPQPPSVICCGNDEMAVRVYGILRTKGIRVPEDVSVAGYDNQLSIAETLFPPLTSAELPYIGMGEKAAEILLDIIAGASHAGSVALAGGVVWRQSVLQKP